MSAVFLLLLLTHAVLGNPLCKEEERVVLPNSENETIQAFGLNFTVGNFWREKSGNINGCPCLFKHCLRHCEIDGYSTFSAPEKNLPVMIHTIYNETIDEFDSLEEEWTKELRQLNEYFFLLNKSATCRPKTFLPEAIITNKGHILAKMTIENETYFAKQDEPFCIYTEDRLLKAWICDSEPEPKPSNLSKVILSSISVIFLLLVVVVFFITPEMQNLQGKNVACQSATLAVGLFALAVINAISEDTHHFFCVFLGYVMYFFTLTSFFWLNTMCFDICWTFSNFKQMASFKSRSNSTKFRWYATYATVSPLALFCILVILDHTLDDSSDMWPGFGKNGCWFRERTTEFLFFQGPLFFISLINSTFFLVTLYRIVTFKREAKSLSGRESKTHRMKKEDNQNFILAVKLFALMGSTWLMDFASWCVNNEHVVWIIFDTINILRGPFYFYFCVVGNKKVRDSLLRRFGLRKSDPRERTTSFSIRDTRTSAFSDSAVVEVIELDEKGFENKNLDDVFL